MILKNFGTSTKKVIIPSSNKEGIMEFPKEWENNGEDDEYWENKFFHLPPYDAENLPYELSDEYLQKNLKTSKNS